jgi:YHS domain-containing protein
MSGLIGNPVGQMSSSEHRLAERANVCGIAAAEKACVYKVNYGGRIYMFHKQEFEDFKKKVIAELKCTAVVAVRNRVDAA